MSGLFIPGYLDTIAIITGALTGALVATRKGLDVLGVLIVAFCTGVGGGLVRDVLLQNGVPTLLLNPGFQLFAAIGAVVGLLFARGAARFQVVYDTLDTLMIGVWTILACIKAEQVGLGFLATVFVGTIAAVGGSLLRDVLCHDISSLVQPGYFYSVAALSAAVTFTALREVNVGLFAAQIAAMAIASGLRILSLRGHFLIPRAFGAISAVPDGVQPER